MSAIDWDAKATLLARDDGGSEMDYNFRTVKQGRLGDIVREVAAMAAADRARLVLDVPLGKSLNVAEIMELAARDDLK